METMKLQKRAPMSAMLDPKIVVPAIRASFTKLDPRLVAELRRQGFEITGHRLELIGHFTDS